MVHKVCNVRPELLGMLLFEMPLSPCASLTNVHGFMLPFGIRGARLSGSNQEALECRRFRASSTHSDVYKSTRYP